MTKLLSALAATLVLSTSLAHAEGIVPGSDTGTRQEQTRQDTAVATGASRIGDGAFAGYGYAGREGARSPAPATDRAAERALNQGAGVRTAPRGALVPGSDSF